MQKSENQIKSLETVSSYWIQHKIELRCAPQKLHFFATVPSHYY